MALNFCFISPDPDPAKIHLSPDPDPTWVEVPPCTAVQSQKNVVMQKKNWPANQKREQADAKHFA